MLMNTTFLGDSFFIKWQSRVIAQGTGIRKRIPGLLDTVFSILEINGYIAVIA